VTIYCNSGEEHLIGLSPAEGSQPAMGSFVDIEQSHIIEESWKSFLHFASKSTGKKMAAGSLSSLNYLA
jgi:hypothetical protein